jgi:DNA-binding SARP family transcriptional activator
MPEGSVHIRGNAVTLEIFFLGQFKIEFEGKPIRIQSRSAQSLIAILVLNPEISFRREALSGMLWPDSTESNARRYLRQALWRIRRSIEDAGLDPCAVLVVDDISLQFKKPEIFWMDAEKLVDQLPEEISIDALERIVNLYRGDFLPGFYDDWVLTERHRIENAFNEKIDLLITRLLNSRKWKEAAHWSEEWIRFLPSQERAFRALIQAYAGMGETGLAVNAYKRCEDALQKDLAISPSKETQSLYRKILRGDAEQESSTFDINLSDPSLPAFLQLSASDKINFEPLFIGRHEELRQLKGDLDLAVNGRSRVVFITGEAGSGKTYLINEFREQAISKYPDLLSTMGSCSAYAGSGDPYLPFREIMQMLTGDVESRWTAGSVSGILANRLWHAMPSTVQAILENGPDVIDTFVAGQGLFTRLESFRPRCDGLFLQLSNIEKIKAQKQLLPGINQSDIFEQYTRVLKSISSEYPILVLIDDLQWADIGSINLLFHLGRNLSGSRILVIGAYRVEEISLRRDGTRHPLEPVIYEFGRLYGRNKVNLSGSADSGFINAVIDLEPNLLDEDFRDLLHEHTQGNPLFLVEMLHEMKDRGNLTKDQQENWIVGEEIDWNILPARIEAVIAERISRLPQHLQLIMAAASVEGEVFTAEVISNITGSGDSEILNQLSNEIDRQHRLIHAHSIQTVKGRLLSRYRFRHNLFQKYIYQNLDPVQRTHLHSNAADALEDFYTDKEGRVLLGEMIPILAYHFEEARRIDKSVKYLHLSGKRAVKMSAYDEAVHHFSCAIELLLSEPETLQRDEQELELLLSLGLGWAGTHGLAAPEVERIYTRARLISEKLNKSKELCRALGELTIVDYVRANYRAAQKLAEYTLQQGKTTGDPLLSMLSLWHLGLVLFARGKFSSALEKFQEVTEFYSPEEHHMDFVRLRGSDIGISSYAYQSCCLWCLGFQDQARVIQSLALGLSRRFNHSFTHADALCYAGCLLESMDRNATALFEFSTELIDLAENKVQAWIGTGSSYLAGALAWKGDCEEAISHAKEGAVRNRARGVDCYSTVFQGHLANALRFSGDLDDALETITDSFLGIQNTDERFYESELFRIQAKIYLEKKEIEQAIHSLNTAIEIARSQRARSWELRASIDLARILHQSGSSVEAKELLTEITETFTEGFNKPDLLTARLLLNELIQV